MPGYPNTHGSAIRSLRHFLKPQKSQNEPVGEWGMTAVLIFSDDRRSIRLEKYEARVKKGILGNSKSAAKNPPETHLLRFSSAFRKFARIAGISYLIESDLGSLLGEAKDWESAYQRPRKQEEEIHVSILEICEVYVLDSSIDITERLFAWSFRVSVSSCLRWGDLLNTSPPTTVLMKDGIIGFAAKTKTRGKPDGRPWGGSIRFF